MSCRHGDMFLPCAWCQHERLERIEETLKNLQSPDPVEANLEVHEKLTKAKGLLGEALASLEFLNKYTGHDSSLRRDIRDFLGVK